MKQEVKRAKAGWSVRAKLNVTFAIILLLPSIFIGLFSYEKAKSNMERQLMEAANENVKILNHMIEQMMQAKVNEVEFLADHIAAGTIETNTDPNVKAIITRFQNKQSMLERTYIGTETGIFIKWPTTQMKGYDPRKRPWYKTAMETPDKTVITNPYIAASSKNVVVTIAKATSDRKGVVGIDVDLKSLADAIREVQIGQKGYPTILDKEGKVLVHPTYKAGESVQEASWIGDILQQKEGQREYTLNGEEKQLVFKTNERTGWKVIGVVLKQEITDAARPVLYTTILVIVITTLVGAVLVYFIISSITSRLKALSSGARKISEGYLNNTIEIKAQDELGELGTHFNQMNESLRDMVAHINETSEHLASSSEELSSSSEQTKEASGRIADVVHQVVNGFEEQAKRVYATTKTVQEMSTAIQHIASHAEGMSDSALRTSELSEEGKGAIQTVERQMNTIYQTVQQLDKKMEVLGERSREIGTVVAFINEIAEQTNLLSLNAAIEAARAGEHGRGFAVVADEVRKLANQTGQASHQIAQEIYRIQREMKEMVEAMKEGALEVENGIHTVSEAGELFSEINRAIQAVTMQVQEISASSQQIAASTEEVVHAMNQIAHITNENDSSLKKVSRATDEQLVSMEEIASSSHSLSQLAERMQEQLHKFTL
jgi:methyl-accepting chemotaxis protein